MCPATNAAPAPTQGPEIWLSALDPVVRRDQRKSGSEDYMQLFAPGAAWSRAASSVTVFEISTQFAFSGSEEQLRKVISGLSQRGMSLAVAGLVLPGPPGPTCGGGVEGYAAPGWLAAALKRLKGFGADVKYIAMDEPLWFGHHYKGRGACRASVEEVAKQVATTVRQVREVYPHVLIGDVEPVSAVLHDWDVALLDWANAYQQATGEPLAFLDLDIQWETDYLPLVNRIQRGAQARNLPIGVIYNGDPRSKTSREWVESARSRFIQAENGGLRPHHVTIATWDNVPSRLLPEDQADTMTHLVSEYSAFKHHR